MENIQQKMVTFLLIQPIGQRKTDHGTVALLRCSGFCKDTANPMRFLPTLRLHLFADMSEVCFETSDLGQTPYLHDPDFKDRSPSVGLPLFSTSVDAAPSPEELYPC
jgi:hypothetical protein